MTEEQLRSHYRDLRSRILVPIAESLERHIKVLLEEEQRIDRVSTRAKGIDRFLGKASKVINGEPKYQHPLREIQDQIGARIVVFYLSDVERVRRIIDDFFAPVEHRTVVPDSVSEFGYEGVHYVLLLPNEVLPPGTQLDEAPKFFELQIKTLFQHAWGEAGHDLAYKPSAELTYEQKRQVAFTAAQAWGADKLFEELAGELEV